MKLQSYGLVCIEVKSWRLIKNKFRHCISAAQKGGGSYAWIYRATCSDLYVIPLVQKKKWKYVTNHEINTVFRKFWKRMYIKYEYFICFVCKYECILKKKKKPTTVKVWNSMNTVNDSSQHYRSSPSNQSSSSDPGPSGSSQWRQQVGYDGYWFYFIFLIFLNLPCIFLLKQILYGCSIS